MGVTELVDAPIVGHLPKTCRDQAYTINRVHSATAPTVTEPWKRSLKQQAATTLTQSNWVAALGYATRGQDKRAAWFGAKLPRTTLIVVTDQIRGLAQLRLG